MTLEVGLRVVSARESAELLEGRGGPAVGLRWAHDYPTADTIIALQLLSDAYAALGLGVTGALDWWLYQVVVVHEDSSEVVGDIGFHGPPDADGAVEVGYCVSPSWRNRGVATAACRQLVDLARELGAVSIVAEASVDNLASRAVLRSAGFSWLAGDRFVATRVEP